MSLVSFSFGSFVTQGGGTQGSSWPLIYDGKLSLWETGRPVSQLASNNASLHLPGPDGAFF